MGTIDGNYCNYVDITSSFENRVNAYNESLAKQKEFGLESLYRGHEKDDPTKCVVIVSAGEGALEKFMEANAEIVAASGHVMESTVLTTYLS